MNTIIRVSYLSGWQDCPRRNVSKVLREWILNNTGYLLRIPLNGVSGLVGTASHTAIIHILETKKNMGENSEQDLKDGIEKGIVKYNSQVEEIINVDYDRTTPLDNIAEKQIEKIATAYFYGIAPEVKPIDLEKRLKVDLDRAVSIENMSYSFTLSGQPDIVTENAIRDIKTGKNAQTSHAQLGAYSLIVKQHIQAWPELAADQGYVLPDSCIIDHVPRVGAKTVQPAPESLTYTSEICENEAKAAISRATWDLATMLHYKDPSKIACNTSSMLCSEKYCQAHKTDFCPVSHTFKTKEAE